MMRAIRPAILLILSGTVFGSSAIGSAGESEEEIVNLEPVNVTANPFVTEKEGLVIPASRMSGSDLARNTASSLGATLESEPGVHSSYFGPGSGRPVIRGFDGDRVRILSHGMDSFDVSQTSPDHGVGIEPIFSRNVDVVRGPATLLYGSSAIGGVVNVVGKDLPRYPATEVFFGEFETAYGSVSDEKEWAAALEGGFPIGEKESGLDFAWSAGFMRRNSGDREIPGFAESDYQLALEGEERESGELPLGVLENSFVDTESAYLGATLFGQKASVGLSVYNYETDYGVPGHEHGHEAEHHEEDEQDEEAGVWIDLDQRRYNLRATLDNPIDIFENVEFQFGSGEYRHLEIEGDEVGTVFERDGIEIRMTAVHRPIGDMTGAIGLQWNENDLRAEGEEAFIASNRTDHFGVFMVERLNRDWGSWEFGGRLESIKIDTLEVQPRSRRFSVANASVGIVRLLGEGATASANIAYAERGPNASELFAFGPHIGTRSFEIGNPSLDTESSLNLDLTYRRSVGFVTGEFTAFFSDFSDYVYMRFLDTNEVVSRFGDISTEGLTVREATASDAQFYGFEMNFEFHLIDREDRRLDFDLLVDQTRATNESYGSNLPRIPTRRIGGRFHFEQGPWRAGLEARYHNAATHLAPNELPSDSYTLLGCDLSYRFDETGLGELELFLVGRNLGDTEARPHTSYLKDLVPMPGRNLKVGLRSRF